MTDSEVKQAIEKFNSSDIVEKVSDYINDTSMMSILNIEEREMSHSAFLAWMFRNSDHNYTIYGLLRLYNRLANSQNIQQFPYDIQSLNLYDLSVHTEYAIEGQKRIDVLIKAKINQEKNLNIIIENKVYSSENDSQTTFYYDYFNKKYSTDDNLYIFLLPLAEYRMIGLKEDAKRKEIRKDDHFVIMGYQQLVDNIIYPLYKSKSTPKSDKIKIESYLKTLVELTMKDGEINMGVNENAQKMINDFWEQNKEIFQKIIEVKCATTTGDLHDSFMAINNEISNTKDNSRYAVEGQGEFTKIGMAKESMKIIIERMQKDGKTYEEIIDEVNRKWGNRAGKKQVLGDSVESFSGIYSDPKARCREFAAMNRLFYIDYKWDIENINEALETFNNVFGVRIEKIRK